MLKFWLMIVAVTILADLTNSQSSPPTTPTSTSGPEGSNPSGCGPGDDAFKSCIQKILDQCTHYKSQFYNYIESFDWYCTKYNNTYVQMFHDNFTICKNQCNIILQLENMRQVLVANNGEPGPSTHCY